MNIYENNIFWKLPRISHTTTINRSSREERFNLIARSNFRPTLGGVVEILSPFLPSELLNSILRNRERSETLFVSRSSEIQIVAHSYFLFVSEITFQKTKVSSLSPLHQRTFKNEDGSVKAWRDLFVSPTRKSLELLCLSVACMLSCVSSTQISKTRFLV